VTTGTVWTDPRFPGVSCRRVGPEALDMLLELKTRLQQDYLPDALPDWLRDSPGGVYAYYYEDQLCGLCSIHIPRPGEAWLRGKRIALGFEGKGIGTATAVFEMEEARRLGARVARLITEVGNAAVHRMMREKLGFRDMGRWWVAEGLNPAALGRTGTEPGAPAVVVLAPGRPADGDAAKALAGLGPLLARHAGACGLDDPQQGGERPEQPCWGLWATLDDPYTLAGFGPQELEEALRAGSTLAVAGPPSAPRGLALLTPSEGWGPILRLFVGADEAAVAALRAWLRSLDTGRLVASLPAVHAAALLGTSPEALTERGGTLFVLYQQDLA